jgi:hypothetical protein
MKQSPLLHLQNVLVWLTGQRYSIALIRQKHFMENQYTEYELKRIAENELEEKDIRDAEEIKQEILILLNGRTHYFATDVLQGCIKRISRNAILSVLPEVAL